MTNREKILKDFECAVRKSHGYGWGFVDGLTTDDGLKILQLLKEQETMTQCIKEKCRICPHCANCNVDENGSIKEQVVKPFHKCIGKCNILIEDSWFNYCPYCGKPIVG